MLIFAAAIAAIHSTIEVDPSAMTRPMSEGGSSGCDKVTFLDLSTNFAKLLPRQHSIA